MRLYLQTLLEVGRQRLAAGHCQKTLDACHRILKLDPWQAHAVLWGMEVGVALNDRSGALRLCMNRERTLREELGMAPQTEPRHHYQSLLA